MIEKQHTAILFDLDGTLLDTAPDLLDSFNQLLIYHKKDPVTMNDIHHMLTHGSRSFIENFFGKELAQEKIQVLREQFWDLYSSANHPKTQFFPGMLELLNAISKAELPWGIVTNKMSIHAQENLAKFSLPSAPRTIVCADTLGISKPDPKPLIHACEQMQVNIKQTVFVGDSNVDALAGKNAKMTTVIVEHGYNAGLEQFHELEIAAWIKDPLEVLKFFKN